MDEIAAGIQMAVAKRCFVMAKKAGATDSHHPHRRLRQERGSEAGHRARAEAEGHQPEDRPPADGRAGRRRVRPAEGHGQGRLISRRPEERNGQLNEERLHIRQGIQDPAGRLRSSFGVLFTVYYAEPGHEAVWAGLYTVLNKFHDRQARETYSSDMELYNSIIREMRGRWRPASTTWAL